MPARSEREVMTPAEVARKLGVGLSKVGGWIHSGELVAVNVATSLAKAQDPPSRVCEARGGRRLLGR